MVPRQVGGWPFPSRSRTPLPSAHLGRTLPGPDPAGGGWRASFLPSGRTDRRITSFSSLQGSGPQHHHQTLLGRPENQDTGRTPRHPGEEFSRSPTRLRRTPLPIPGERAPPLLPLSGHILAGDSLHPLTFGLSPWANHSIVTSSSHKHPSFSDKPLTGHTSSLPQHDHCLLSPFNTRHTQTPHAPPRLPLYRDQEQKLFVNNEPYFLLLPVP